MTEQKQIGERGQIEGEFFALEMALGADGEHRPFLKVELATEGDDRFAYCKPSNESPDDDGERILQEALIRSGYHYLKFGNVDLNHFTKIGPRLSEFVKGRQNMTAAEAALYELGRPVEVLGLGHRFRLDPDGRITHEENSALRVAPLMMKARIRRGEGSEFEQANQFWRLMTSGERYHPSVAGNKLGEPICDPASGVCTITEAIWDNTAFAAPPFCPRNRTVDPVTHLAPVEFLKAMPAAEFVKALTSGYTADVAQLSGGSALRRESLHGADLQHRKLRYLQAAARLIKGEGDCQHVGNLNQKSLTEHFRKCEGMEPAHAEEASSQLLRALLRARGSDPQDHSAAAAA